MLRRAFQQFRRYALGDARDALRKHRMALADGALLGVKEVEQVGRIKRRRIQRRTA